MSRLLALPQEIRDLILSHAIYGVRRPPRVEDLIREVRAPAPTYKTQLDHNVIFHTFRAPEVPGSSLLRTSRVIQDETKKILHFNRKIIYKLDVVVLDETALYPTWLSVPILCQFVDTLEITVRISGHARGLTSLLRDAAEGPGELVWGLYTLLLEFFDAGPFRPGISRYRTDVFVKNLVIRCVSDDPTKTPLHSSAASDMVEKEKGTYCGDAEVHPHTLSEYLARRFGRLCDMTYPNIMDGARLFRQVGDMVFRAEYSCGDSPQSTSSKIILNDVLPTLECWPQSTMPRELADTLWNAHGYYCYGFIFWDWKYRTCCHRQAIGLLHEDFEPLDWPNLAEWQYWRSLCQQNPQPCKCPFNHGSENVKGYHHPSQLEAKLLVWATADQQN